VDPSESVAQAALREAREELGLEVELTRLIGVYSRPRWYGDGSHIVAFAARLLDGDLNPDPSEVIDVGYFTLEELPEDMIWWHRQRAVDALNGVGGGVAWRQETEWPFQRPFTRQEVYSLRDQSGLSRREFYFKFFGDHKGAQEYLEVADED